MLSQLLSTGKQTLLVGASGQATGGVVNLSNDFGSGVHNLTVPQSITALQNFASGQALSITGLLTNAGNIQAYSTSAITQGTFNSSSLLNQTTGVISSPSGISGSARFQPASSILDLTFNVTNDFINHGLITGSGSVTINSANVVNTGTISIIWQ